MLSNYGEDPRYISNNLLEEAVELDEEELPEAVTELELEELEDAVDVPMNIILALCS